MGSLSDGENECEIESIRLLATALEADKCDKNIVISSQNSVGSAVSAVTGSQGDVILTNEIETALAFNKVMEEKLIKLENVLLKELEECKLKINEIHKITFAQSSEPSGFRYITCGRPYFKDNYFFPGPSNSDVATMKENKMYDFNGVAYLSGWTVKDKRSFAKEILKVSQQAKKKELESEIAKLRREAGESDVNVKKNIKKLQKEIEEVDNKTIAGVAFPLDKEYDWDMFSNVLKHRHKPQEFRAMWKLYLHPSINKTDWSREEQEKLLALVDEHEFRDWDTIAHKLGTARTGYQCFVFFRTHMNNATTGIKWSKEEEEYLKRLIAVYRDGNYIPWPKIAAKMGTRSKLQIYGKYMRLQDQKGRFHKEEDDVLLTCVSNFGPDFKKIANEFLVGRTHRQLRLRYKKLKASTRVSTLWTPEEDKRLIQFVSHNSGAETSNTNFANIVEHFPGKNRSHLRSRYLTLVKWMRLHPRVDISKAPRKGVRRLGHGGVVENLSTAIAKLKNKLTSECEKTTKQKLCLSSSELEIDDALTAVLINEKALKEADNTEQAISIDEGQTYLEPQILNSHHLSNMLILLRAKLNKNVFQRSRNWSSKYPNLMSETVSYVKPATFSSYSRKNRVKEVKMLGSTDIWGNALLSHTEYVFSPHFAPITGLRKLMHYAMNIKRKEVLNFARKNAETKAQYDLFLNRFQQLFLWPMMLSNHKPSKTPAYTSESSNETYESIQSTEPASSPTAPTLPKLNLPLASVVAIPNIKNINKRFKKNEETIYKIDEDYEIILQDNQRRTALTLEEPFF